MNALTQAAGTDSQLALVRDLIDYIRSDGLAVGDRLPPIRALAERFEVKGSAVRDAQIQLQTMGLIKILPRSGAYVQSVSYEPLVGAFSDTLENALTQADPSLFHLLDARQLLEVECATKVAQQRRIEELLPLREALEETLATAQVLEEKAAMKLRVAHYDADIRLHLAIANLAGNPVLTTMLRSVLALLKPHLVRIPWDAKRKRLTIKAHRKLFEALRSGDIDKVRACMNEHAEMARDTLLKQLWSKQEAE